MIKCFCIRFKPEKYAGTIVSMPPVNSVKKTKSNIPATRQHIWLKLFLNKPLRGCRDVRKSYDPTANKFTTKKFLRVKIAKVTNVPMRLDEH